MNKNLKYLLFVGLGFGAYKLYQLYKLSDSIVYKPLGIKFYRGKGLNDFAVQVVMQIFNPANTELKMKDVGGTLAIDGNVISTYSSGEFVIKKGLTEFPLTFKISSLSAITAIATSALRKKPIRLDVTLNKNLGLVSSRETFSFGQGDLPADTSKLVFN